MRAGLSSALLQPDFEKTVQQARTAMEQLRGFLSAEPAPTGTVRPAAPTAARAIPITRELWGALQRKKIFASCCFSSEGAQEWMALTGEDGATATHKARCCVEAHKEHVCVAREQKTAELGFYEELACFAEPNRHQSAF
jgi:hypothetical protein